MTPDGRVTAHVPRWRGWALVALLVLAAACGAPQQSEATGADTQELLAAAETAKEADADTQAAKSSSDGDDDSSASSAEGTAAQAETTTQGGKADRPNTAKVGSTSKASGTAGRSGAQEPKGSQQSVQPPPAGTMEFDATVEPACVRPGGTATITVLTKPQAGVGYHAIYADGKGGAAPPYGAGYGGNAGELADADGRYTDTWTVSPKAPTGDGHVEVVVGSGGDMGQGRVPFSVADPVTGTCAP